MRAAEYEPLNAQNLQQVLRDTKRKRPGGSGWSLPVFCKFLCKYVSSYISSYISFMAFRHMQSEICYCPRPLEGCGHVTLARGDSNTLRLRRAPLNSGFSRKSREKRLEFRAGLYFNRNISAYTGLLSCRAQLSAILIFCSVISSNRRSLLSYSFWDRST